jgi:hypothetical protein
MPITQNGQTCLESIAIQKRPVQEAHNEYADEKPYGENVAEKSTGHGGHSFFMPDCSKAQMIGEHFDSPIDYSNFDTFNGGSQCDEKGVPSLSHSGRIGNQSINNYGPNKPYGANLINTELNVADGQYVVGTTQRTPIICNP